MIASRSEREARLKVAEIKNRVWFPLGVYQFALKCNRSSFSLILKEANGKDEPLRKRFPFAFIRDAPNYISSYIERRELVST